MLSVKSDTIPQLIKECNQFRYLVNHIDDNIRFRTYLIHRDNLDMRWATDTKLSDGVTVIYRHPYSSAMRIRYCNEAREIITELIRKLNRRYILELPHQVDIYGKFDPDHEVLL